MNKTIGIVIGVVVIIGGIYLATRTPSPDNVSLNAAKQNQNTSYQGRVVFSVTDAAVDMNTISEINMKVNSVEIHNSTSGWMTVSTTPRTYSLLSLNTRNESELLADISVETGTYDQVRLMVDTIAIVTKAGATKEAKLPSGELKINTVILVTANNTSSVNFDFIADKSLHATSNGNYIFAPVVKTESRSEANVSVNASNVVSIGGGNVDNTNTVGMDIDGNVKLNFQIDNKQKLNIDNKNIIQVEL